MPFELIFTYMAIGWQVKILEPNYNYKAFMHAAALLHYCQYTKELKKTIANMSVNSIAFNKILTNLLKKDITIGLKNIYNKQQINKKQLLNRLFFI